MQRLSRFWVYAIYCSKPPRCIKCAGNHYSKDCTKPTYDKPKCFICSEIHPGNYRVSIVAKDLQKIRSIKTNQSKRHVPPRNQIVQKDQPSTAVSSKMSFDTKVKSNIQTLQPNRLIATFYYKYYKNLSKQSWKLN